MIDNVANAALFRRVHLIRKMAAFLLVALWLPTVQHCMLEAAGLLSAQEEHTDHTTCCASPSGACDTASCNVLESGNYRPSASSTDVPAPLFTVCSWLFGRPTPELLREVDKIAVTARTSFERPPDCSPTWQFVQRTALSPRAPSLVVA